MKLNNKILLIALLCIILIIFIVALIPSTTYDMEAEVLSYIGDDVYCEDANGNVWILIIEGYVLSYSIKHIRR